MTTTSTFPRYVDTFVPEEDIDFTALQKEISQIEAKLAEGRGRMSEYLKELGVQPCRRTPIRNDRKCTNRSANTSGFDPAPSQSSPNFADLPRLSAKESHPQSGVEIGLICSKH